MLVFWSKFRKLISSENEELILKWGTSNFDGLSSFSASKSQFWVERPLLRDLKRLTAMTLINSRPQRCRFNIWVGCHCSNHLPAVDIHHQRFPPNRPMDWCTSWSTLVNFTTMWGPQDSVQLVYNSNNYGLWYANSLYKPTNKTGGPTL